MSTPFYDLASLVVVPSGYKASKVYAQKPLTTDGQLTFSRASAATRVNSAGLIETVSSNVPRLDYLGSTCPKLLLEPSRTNLLQQNTTFATPYWSYDPSAGLVPNAATSPDGTTLAPRLTFSTSGQAVYRVGLGLSGTHRFSVYLKGEGANIGKQINLEIGAASGSTNVTLTGEWKRFTAVCDNAGSVAIKRLTSDQADSVLAWGAQVEAGSYITSVILTTTAAVTRLEDECNKTSVSTLIGQAEGTLFVEADLTNSQVNNAYLIQVSESGSNRFFIYREGTTNKLGCFALIGSSTIYTQLTAAAVTGTIKAAFAYKSGSFAFYVNGVQVGTSAATFTTPATMGRFDIDANAGNENAYYKYSEALLFKTRLTNAQLAELTTL